MAKSTTNRVLTDHDKLVATRLNAIYQNKKHALKLTQAELAKLVGLTSQSTVSCYLKGHIALRNARTLVNFANALEVAPHEIDPDFQAEYRGEDDREKPTVVFSSKATVSNQKLKHLFIDNAHIFAVALRKDMFPHMPSGTKALCKKDAPLHPEGFVMINHGDRYELGQLQRVTQKSIRILPPGGTETSEATLIMLKDIASVTPIIGFELP